MSEGVDVAFSASSFLVLGVFSILYVLGGRAGSAKWVRRWAGGLFLALSLQALALLQGTWNPIHLGILIGLPMALSLGYGGDTLWRKIYRRFLYGMALGCQSLWFLPHHFEMILFQIILSVTASLVMGLSNSTRPVFEEFLISLLGVVSLPFLVTP